MTSGKDAIGEQPIFTCKAHVFHIDPKTKRSWMPASSTAVSVSFFYDSSRSLYRIISVEGQKAVINSTVTPNMTFTKTSQKFGQWSDIRANTVYGLGFSSEAELQKFIDKFNEVKEATRNTLSNKSSSNGGNVTTPVTSANASPITARASNVADSNDHLSESLGNVAPPPQDIKMEDDLPHVRNLSVSNIQPNESPSHQNKNENKYSSTEMQLKYDNDRLKLALAQSSANAKKWEIELATLKSNNARLTSALQESTANVEEWKRQLASLKEENMRMKAKYQNDLENSSGGGDIADKLRKEVHALRIKVEQLEAEIETKSSDLKLQNNFSQSKDYQILQKENQELAITAKLAQQELDMALKTHESQKKVLLTLNNQLSAKIQELETIFYEVNTALQT